MASHSQSFETKSGDRFTICMERRPSRQFIEVLRRLQMKPCWGYELQLGLEVSSKTVYRTLDKLRDWGIADREISPSEEKGKPPRKMYRLNEKGKLFAKWAIPYFEADEALRQTEESE